MAIIASEYIIYRAAGNDDAVPGNNGGEIDTSAPIASLVANGHFPEVTPADRTGGDTKWRKIFPMIRDSEEGYVTDARQFLREDIPVGDDAQVYIRQGNWNDIETGQLGTRDFGVGFLAANANAAATTATITIKDGTIGASLFQAGDTVVVRDATNEEYLILASNATMAGNDATLNFTTGLVNSYVNGTSWIAGCINYGTIRSVMTAPTISGSGTLDQAQVTINNTGARFQIWTLTFTDATNFTASGDTIGAITGGAINTTYSPTDPNLSQPYFTIPTGAWGGTFAASDTVTFTTMPCGTPLWVKRVIPAGSGTSTTEIARTRLTGLAQTP